MSNTSFLLIRGIIGVIAGLLALALPGVTIAVLVILFGIYAFLDGVTTLALGARHDGVHGRSWGWLVQGIVGILAGVVAFVWPGAATLALIMLVAAWAIVTGVLEIAAAIRLRRILQGEWLLALSGCLSLLFGLIAMVYPALGWSGLHGCSGRMCWRAASC